MCQVEHALERIWKRGRIVTPGLKDETWATDPLALNTRAIGEVLPLFNDLLRCCELNWWCPLRECWLPTAG